MASWPYSTAKWQRLRRQKLDSEPLCEDCLRLAKVTVATVVDHIVPIKRGGPAYPDLAGLRALCVQCHNIKTNALDHPNAKGIAPGCDVNGVPLDPNHPWRSAMDDVPQDILEQRRRDDEARGFSLDVDDQGFPTDPRHPANRGPWLIDRRNPRGGRSG